MSDRPPVSAMSSAARVFTLTWPALAWARRTPWLLPLLAWPLLPPLLGRLAGVPSEWTASVGWIYRDLLLPLAVLFQASRLIRQDVESGTIVYLLARPAPRASIVAGQFAAYAAAALAVVLPAIAVGFVLGARAQGLDVLASALAASTAVVVLYGAFFMLAGLMLKKPMVPGLVAVLVALALSYFPGGLSLLSPTTHLRTLSGDPPPLPELTALMAAGVLALAAVACLATAVIVFKNGEYLPEP